MGNLHTPHAAESKVNLALQLDKLSKELSALKNQSDTKRLQAGVRNVIQRIKLVDQAIKPFEILQKWEKLRENVISKFQERSNNKSAKSR